MLWPRVWCGVSSLRGGSRSTTWPTTCSRIPNYPWCAGVTFPATNLRGKAQTYGTERWSLISSTSPVSKSAHPTAATSSTAWPAPSTSSPTTSSTPPTNSFPTLPPPANTSPSTSGTPTRPSRTSFSMKVKRHRFKHRRGCTHRPKVFKYRWAATQLLV